MPEEEMNINERRKYLKIMQKRYQQTGRQEQAALLTEMEATTGLHRKSLIRLMKTDLKRKPRSKQRGRTYGVEVDDALRVIAESSDYICAERLTPNLGWMATHLARHREMSVSEELLAQLEDVSPSTVKRILARLRQDEPRLPRKKPMATNGVACGIPMKRIAWDEREPGHFETDLVHHCGWMADGQYVHTLQMIDVATGWSERVAVLGRSYLVMSDGFRRIQARLPFPIVEIHPDNGMEFLNELLVRFWKEQVKIAELSRSRPYQKNDNRFVEQKNSSLVRTYFGDMRLETVSQTIAVNQFYDKMWLYYNFFQPVLRLSEKEIVSKNGQGSRIKRRYDPAQTPFDRLCATSALSEPQKQALHTLRSQTNPRRLRQEIYELRDRILTLPSAVAGKTEDVRETLLRCSPGD